MTVANFLFLFYYAVSGFFLQTASRCESLAICHNASMHWWMIRIDTDFRFKNTDSPHEIVACLIFSLGRRGSTELGYHFIKFSELCQCIPYSRRVLSFIGKSVILQSVLHTPRWYVGNVLLMPEAVRIKLNRLLFKLLWNDKLEALKRATLLHGFSKGGLDVVDIRTQLQSFLVKHVL